MRIIACGSRTWGEIPPGLTGAELAYESMRVARQSRILTTTLDSAVLAHRVEEIIDGGAKGADTKAALYAMNKGIDSYTIMADWGRLGRAAGPLRNQKMLERDPGLVVAFVNKPLALSKGTADMVERSREAGVPTWVIEDYSRR